jgi:gamma-glutamyltranspeptidase / glutathione hydrolase
MKKSNPRPRSSRGENGGLSETYGKDDQRSSRISRRPLLAGLAALSAGGLVTGLTAAQRVVPEDPSELSVESGDEGVVSTPHPIASEVGAQVLEQGGNAVDAAVAIQLTLSVVTPHATGLGGGGFMMVHDAQEGESYAINGQVRAPAAAQPDRFEGVTSDVTQSGLAVGAPGTPRTLEVALDRWGSASASELIAPAITLSRGVTEVDAELDRAIGNNAGRLSSEAAAVFSEFSAGDTLVQEDLAETLEILSEEGFGAFYEGEIADDIASTVQDNGGDLTTEDLANYEVTVEEPVVGRVNGCPCLTPPPPSNGIAAIQMLKLLEPLGVSDFDIRSAEKYNLLLEAAHLAYADIGAHYGDTEFVDAPIDGLLDDMYLARRRDEIEQGTANPSISPGDPRTFQDGSEAAEIDANGDLPVEASTTHFSVADSEGNVVSYTSTLSLFFGTGIMVPDRGLLLANSLTNFNFESGGLNEVEGNKRPSSTMSPMIVLDDGVPIFTAGASGGGVIPAVVAQVVHHVLEYGSDPATAVSEPRVFSGAYPTVEWESGITEETRNQLSGIGYDIEPGATDIGNAQLLSLNEEYVGVADSRREGEAIGIPRNDQ